MRAISAAKSSAGNVLVSGSPPASEMTSGRAVTPSGRAWPRTSCRACGARTARRSARSRARWSAARRRWPAGVSSIVMRRDRTLARHALRPRPPAGPRHRRRGRHPARSCRRCSSARSPPANLGLDFDGTNFAFLEQPWPSWWRCVVVVRGARPCSSAGAAATLRVARGLALRCWRGIALVARRAAGLPGRSPTAAHVVARAARRRGRRRARLRGRALAVRPRARPPGRRGRRRAAALRRGRRAAGAPALSILLPPLAILVVAGAGLAARRRPPPRRREVRGPAHPPVTG